MRQGPQLPAVMDRGCGKGVAVLPPEGAFVVPMKNSMERSLHAHFLGCVLAALCRHHGKETGSMSGFQNNVLTHQVGRGQLRRPETPSPSRRNWAHPPA